MVTGEAILPDGTSLHTLASIGEESCRENLPEASNEIRVSSVSWFKKKYACGHRGPRKFELFVYGIAIFPTERNQQCPDCCIEEIKKTVIRCASCELPILPGDGVVLYHPITPGLNLAVANFVTPDAVICCMRWDCCAHPGSFAGHWTKEGFKPFSF